MVQALHSVSLIRVAADTSVAPTFVHVGSASAAARFAQSGQALDQLWDKAHVSWLDHAYRSAARGGTPRYQHCTGKVLSPTSAPVEFDHDRLLIPLATAHGGDTLLIEATSDAGSDQVPFGRRHLAGLPA